MSLPNSFLKPRRGFIIVKNIPLKYPNPRRGLTNFQNALTSFNGQAPGTLRLFLLLHLE
jgi:hypothetical protein